MEIKLSKTKFRRELNSVIRNLKKGKYDVVKVTRNQEVWRIAMTSALFNKIMQ